MTTLLPESEAVRVAKALQIFHLLSDGYTVDDACEKVGFTKRQYYYWIRRSDQTIDAIRHYIAESERGQLAQITAARQLAIDRIIEQLEFETELEGLIKADQHLHFIQRELEDRHGAHGIDDTSAKEFLLQGPQTRTETSRLFNIAPREDGSIDIRVEVPATIIESHFEEESDHESKRDGHQ